jgi:ferredoxin
VTLHVKADSEKCCGYGICAEICPSIFKLDSQGFVYIEDELVPEELEESAVEGAEACPELAITVLQS